MKTKPCKVGSKTLIKSRPPGRSAQQNMYISIQGVSEISLEDVLQALLLPFALCLRNLSMGSPQVSRGFLASGWAWEMVNYEGIKDRSMKSSAPACGCLGRLHPFTKAHKSQTIVLLPIQWELCIISLLGAQVWHITLVPSLYFENISYNTFVLTIKHFIHLWVIYPFNLSNSDQISVFCPNFLSSFLYINNF